MKVLVVYLVVQVSTLVLISAKIPDGYKLNLDPHCGSDGIEDAIITITTDLGFINATAECSNGDYLFETTGDIQFDLEASFPPSGEDNCVFHKRTGYVYYFNVAITYGSPGDELQQFEDMYTVVCSFSPMFGNQSFDHDVIEGIIAPTEISDEQTVDSPVTIELAVTDVLGRNITGMTIDMGRSIQLKLEVTDVPESSGIFPSSCDAINGAKRYAVLRAGCGDGVIFKKDQGFTTTGKVSRSPFFKAFAVGRSPSLRFECRVSFCSGGCDGSTCENERFRRSADGGKYILASTATRRLVHVPLILDVTGTDLSSSDHNQHTSRKSTRNGRYHVFGQISKTNRSMVSGREDGPPAIVSPTREDSSVSRDNVQQSNSPVSRDNVQQSNSPVSRDNVQQSNSSDYSSLDQQNRSDSMGASREDNRHMAQRGNLSSAGTDERSQVERIDASKLSHVSANSVADENSTATLSGTSSVQRQTGVKSIHTGILSVLEYPDAPNAAVANSVNVPVVPNPVVSKLSNMTVPQNDDSPINKVSVEDKNIKIVQSGFVFVKGEMANNILGSMSSVQTSPESTVSVTEGSAEDAVVSSSDAVVSSSDAVVSSSDAVVSSSDAVVSSSDAVVSSSDAVTSEETDTHDYKNTYIFEDSDTLKDTDKSDTNISDGHVLSGVKPMYIIGIIIGSLASLAGIILAISLWRRRRQQSLA